jgi:hypothetical protein
LITSAEIAHGLAGAIRIIRLDARVVDWFDDSLAAARRSFWGAAIAFPFHVLVELTRPADSRGAAVAFDPSLTVLEFIIGWTAYPLAAWHLSRAFGLGAGYPRYLTAYNWWNTLQWVALSPVIAATASAGPEMRGMVLLGIVLLYASYAVFTARIVLRAELGQAIILMAVDLLISQLLAQVMAAIRAAPPA